MQVVFCTEIVLISSKMQFIELFFVPLQQNIQHKYVFIMARPIREAPVLKGEDAFRSTFGRLQGKNFEMRRLEVEHMSKEQRAENRRKLEERIANAKNKIEWCW